LRVSWVFRTVDACYVNPNAETFREAFGKVHRIQAGVKNGAKRQRVSEERAAAPTMTQAVL
jgi:hypothetical protein